MYVLTENTICWGTNIVGITEDHDIVTPMNFHDILKLLDSSLNYELVFKLQNTNNIRRTNVDKAKAEAQIHWETVPYLEINGADVDVIQRITQ